MAAQIPAGLPQPLRHPAIGEVQGKYNKGVIQYLGLKYASLEDRFAEPKVLEYSGNEKIDGTRHGPTVVMPSGSAKMEMGFIQCQLPELDVPGMSDLNGLNLNITVPMEGGSNLPVIVYIHGGGFTFGSSSYPHYDQSKVIELSAIMNQPTIAINFNYRLGIAGFLTSQELRSAGYKPNRGLLDQRAALKWVKRYISGFGGDPNKLTVVGQSAGAASVNFMMHSEEKLFSRAILLGGSFLMMKPTTLQTAEEMYGAVTKTLGLDKIEPRERVNRLIHMPQELLVSQISKEMTSLGPALDGSIVPTAATFAEIGNSSTLLTPGYTWLERLHIIDSQSDGTIFSLVNLQFRQKGIKNAFSSFVLEKLGQQSGSTFLSDYGFTDSTTDTEAVSHITDFITHIAFYAPAIKIAETYPGRVSVSHFNERNPWDGTYKGKTNHLLDIAFMWGNYNQSYQRQNWTVARAMAEDLVSFASEKDSPPVFQQTKRDVTVYGPSEEDISSHVVAWNDEATRRNFSLFKLADAVGGLDTLLDLAHGFLAA
ncbi:unnamed protein product [Clonostachys rosea]|uniref:Carboxylic ester hydrolase n=1 Tax=Bionectria ochroleuca TaxID=29856 RepID=A0ABY6V1N9_BIOOC|nr:unnamed protein product [Clonostachys rosea]